MLQKYIQKQVCIRSSVVNDLQVIRQKNISCTQLIAFIELFLDYSPTPPFLFKYQIVPSSFESDEHFFWFKVIMTCLNITLNVEWKPIPYDKQLQANSIKICQ